MTSIPSVILVMQAATSFGEPAISTMHRRQAPRSWIPWRWQRPGMSIPFSSATSMIVWPSDAGDVAAVDPERVDGGHAITSAGCSIAQTPAGQTLVHDVGEVLVPEVAQRAEDRVGRALAEAAERHLLDDPGQPLELGEVLERRPGRG